MVCLKPLFGLIHSEDGISIIMQIMWNEMMKMKRMFCGRLSQNSTSMDGWMDGSILSICLITLTWFWKEDCENWNYKLFSNVVMQWNVT